MPKKKSVKLASKKFRSAADSIVEYVEKTSGLKEEYHSWCADYAIIRLYREFEALMLDAIAGAINNDAKTISETVGFNFPKHLNLSVCHYLVVGTGFFDFRGRDGLISVVKEFVPDTHYLLKIIKDAKYKDTLERLSALRNFAAHNSAKSHSVAVKSVGGERIGAAGAWLKKQERFKGLAYSLKDLASDIENNAPY